MAELTRRQRSIYEFIVAQVRRQGIPPTLMEIAEEFGLSSAAGIADHLKAIERKGYIRRRPGASRGIELARRSAAAHPARRSIAVPVLGDVPSAGGIGRRATRRIFLDARLAAEGLFALRAREALPEGGILAGDLLVVRPGSAGNGLAGLAVGSQGRNVVLLEVASDGRTARPLRGRFDPRRGLELRGGVVAVIRGLDGLERS